VPPHPKPGFKFRYDTAAEVAALRQHRELRRIPAKSPSRLLLATWNIANLGVQDRRKSDHELIAEILGWFDLIAVQEVNDNLAGIQALHAQLPSTYRLLFSDESGNNERQAFLYDSTKVHQLEKVGRLSIPPAEERHIKLKGIRQKFAGFDRGPYMAAFSAGRFRCLLVNVHLYFGSAGKAAVERRMLEAFAIARWADLRQKSPNAFTRDILALGDFNLPIRDDTDPIYKTLTSRGLHIPEHKSVVGGSSLGGHNHYDQVAFFPGETAEFVGHTDVFDFDNALFRRLFEKRSLADYLAYLRYYISDHRPLWAEFQI
jgi:endonuclease/exonuclease/phosphatase family metal-dependent hydrolase